MGFRRLFGRRIRPKRIIGRLAFRRKTIKGLKPLKENDPRVADLKLISTDYTHLDSNGKVIFRLWKNKIPKKYLNNLVKSSRALKKAFRPRIKKSKSYHLGYWRRFRRTMFRSADANYSLWWNKGVFIDNVINKKFFKMIDRLFYWTDKTLHNEYAAIQTPGPRVVGDTFLMCVVNWGGTGPHYDHMDRPDGLCFVVPFGTFKGGDLVFSDLGYRIQFEAGDVIFFQSQKLLHENMPVTEGERQSIVFCTDRYCFN